MFNFDLQVSRSESDRLRAAVVGSPAGESGPFESPWPEVSFEQALYAADVTAARLGAELAAAALPPPLWALWRESLGRAAAAPLRLRLHTDAAAAHLPWELLYDAERAVFPARDAATPVVRYLEGPIALPTFTPGPTAPVLLTAAAPADLNPIDAAILERLHGILRAGAFPVAALEPHLRSDSLGALLVRHRPAVFHYFGHAAWHARDRQGYLILEDRQGGPEPLAASHLAGVLRSQAVQLVVLAACAGADSDPDDGVNAWSGLAQALVQGGVPAVLAMRGRIDAAAAGAFVEAFYTALASGRPYDCAANLARNVAALAAMNSGAPGAWLQPQLFMRSPRADLVQAAQPRAAAKQAETSTIIHNLTAGVVITGDANNPTFNFQGATIGAAPPASGPLASQFAPPSAAGFDDLARQVSALAMQMQAVLDALNQQRIDEYDVNAILLSLQELFIEVQRHNDLLLDAGAAVDLAQVQSALASSEAGVKQRFKVTLPLLLWFLSYEAEFEWDGRVDLVAAWERLQTRLARRAD